jgi:hypothetical protein
VKSLALTAAAAFLVLAPTTWAASTAPHPPASAPAIPTGTLSVCNTSGARPISGALTFTIAAPAADGGTQTVTVPVGSCSTQIFYPQGSPVTVTESVPAGYSVTSIAIGGGASTLTANTPAAGSAAVTIGSGQSLLTFVTSGPPRPCKVPAVSGMTLLAARGAITKSSCGVGRVHRAYSRGVRLGRVISQYPRRGTTLTHGAPVDVLVSRGPR